MYLKVALINYIKYINKESEDKALRELINKEGVAEVTTKEERREHGKECQNGNA